MASGPLILIPIFSAVQSWKMIETEKVVALIRSVECWRLGNWDGCCCSNFSVRNVDIDISCGKGREQAVWVSSHSYEYHNKENLRPIMDEVIRQIDSKSGRIGEFARYYHEWKQNPRECGGDK